MNRRTVLHGAWSVPVILAATATPAAAASTVPIPTNVCQDGRVTFSSDRKNTRTDHLTITNHTGSVVYLAGWVQTSAQVALVAVQVTGGSASGFVVADFPNKASGVLVVPAGGELTVRVVTEKPDAEAHLWLDCGDSFILKSVRVAA